LEARLAEAQPPSFQLGAWEAVNRALAPRTVSRASVINFLKKMAAEGLLWKDEVLGKGGIKDRYKSVAGVSDSEENLKYTLKRRVMDSLLRELVG